MREDFDKRFERIRRTLIGGSSVSNADGKWLCAELLLTAKGANELALQLKTLKGEANVPMDTQASQETPVVGISPDAGAASQNAG